ncbi:MAG TPA: carboxypeptidase-like regulatory domain-containing protein [Gemmatimonadaceae bacterium]
MASLVLSGCHRRASEDTDLLLHRCTTRVQTKGRTAKLPPTPSLRSGFGAVIGTLADSGGALPHYPILATAPGDAPTAPHASATADSLGGFVFGALTPGRYRLFVHAYAHRPDSTDIQVVAGRVDTVRISPQFFQCVR